MAAENLEIEKALERKYSAGFITDIEMDSLQPDLDDELVRFIYKQTSERK